jgi:hypothetical protein
LALNATSINVEKSERNLGHKSDIVVCFLQLLIAVPVRTVTDHVFFTQFRKAETTILVHVYIYVLHNEELHGLYSSPSIVRVIKARRMRWAGHVEGMGEMRGAYNILVGRPEGRRPLGRPRHRWEDTIKIDLREIGFWDVDWIHWAQDRDRWRALVNTVMNLRVP